MFTHPYKILTSEAQKSVNEFICESCDFKCCRKNDYERHTFTRKHKILTKSLQKSVNTLKSVEQKKYTCNCGREYNHRQSLSFHKKKCLNNTNKEEEEPIKEDVDLLKYLMKENSDLKSIIVEVCKSMPAITSEVINTNSNNALTTNSNNTTNNTINNTLLINNTNNTFNLHFFLNETCKDAMNLSDFVDSIKIQLSDLENVGKNGFVTGITDIIVKNLKALDVTMRPVHCSDQKREVMYVKEDDKWCNDSKEEPENQKLKKAIKQVAHKNICMIKEWKDKYPDCVYAESRKSDLYNKIIYEAMDYHNKMNCEKVIKKIAKEVFIEKNNFLV